MTVDEATRAAEADAKPTPPRRPGLARGLRVLRTMALPVLLVAFAASAGLAAWLYFFQHRIDQQTDRAVAESVANAAKTGTVALLTYTPESVDSDVAAGKSHLTGSYLSYYAQFTQQVIIPAAKQRSVKTIATVPRAAVSELRPDSATVLVFVNQTTTSKQNPDGAFAASAVKVGMRKINGSWLISSFDPV